MKSQIINYIRAGYPGLYLVSHEEQRVALEMTQIAQQLNYNLVFWSVVDGLVDTQKGTNNSANDPLEALIAIKDLKGKTGRFCKLGLGSWKGEFGLGLDSYFLAVSG